MKRFIIPIAGILVLVAAFFIGRKSTEPQYVEPMSFEIPNRTELNREVRKVVAATCAQGQPLSDGTTFDQYYYNAPDYWQDCRVNKIGDCEDWALAFLNVFREKYPHLADRAAVHILQVRDPRSYEWGWHAATIINIGPGYVLDNLESAVYTLEAKADSYRNIQEAEQRGTRYVKVERSNV